MPIENEVIIWFNIPPKVEKGAFNYLSKYWPNKVYYVILNDLAEYRKNNGWDDDDFGNAEVIKLWGVKDVDTYIQSFCECHPSAIHIINGFTNTIQKKVRRVLKGSRAHIGVYTERPSYYGNFLERIFRRVALFFKYTAIRFRDEKRTDFVLPLGGQGVKAFMAYGWRKENLFRFMYNPVLSFPSPITRKTASSVRFIYVGRFYFKTKGVDVLMKACNYLYGSWSLDFVGGYGKDSQAVIDWINTNSNVNFIGNWKAEQVLLNLQNYDVVIVPSKCDGWNLLINESIAAGVGCISSDEAVSQELILASGAGEVYHWNRPKELAKHMQKVIDRPEIVQHWKNKAIYYRSRIDSDVVGKYLIDILHYVYYHDQNQSIERPRCPWI